MAPATVREFWYRRITEIVFVMSLVIIGIWSVGFMSPQLAPITGTLISQTAAIAAAATFILSLPLYIFFKRSLLQWASLLSFVLMLATVALTILTTDHAHSPFVGLWMVLSLFAGLYGVIGFAFIALSDAAYITYLLTAAHANIDTITLILGYVVPLVISFIVWRQRSHEEDKGSQAYTALARELNQVANKSEIVINGIADGVIAIDGHGTIQLINPAAQTIMGWGKQDAMELDYRSVFKLYDNKDQALTDENDPVQSVLKGSKSITRNDLSLATSTGKKMIISLLISPVGQTGTGAIIVFRDITGDVVENRQKAEFISTASHEMRTPVAAIEGYIGLALNPQTATIDDKARGFLTKAHESAQHLGHLFQDLLDVSKAEDGRLGNNQTPIDVISFVRDIVGGLMATAIGKQLQLVYNPDVSKPGANASMTPAFYVHADQSHYREVLANVIENAIKYTKAGGTITVDVSGDESHVIVSVVDTGIGIPKEDIPHLFQKFYRVDNSDTREIGGTGLGLYLCRRLVEAMNGRIWVESDYGKGSMFFVELARMSNGAVTTTPTDAPASSQPATPDPQVNVATAAAPAQTEESPT